MDKSRRPQIVGPYEILATLGHGGMGNVYKARHITTGDVVAIKVATDHVAQHPTLSKRFHTEFLMATEHSHPNLVRALDYGEADKKPYLVMELMDGLSLDKHLKKNGVLVEGEALALFGQVLAALQFLHSRRIIHRDIKPANILLGSNGVAKLGDFGLGKDLESDSVLTRSHMGLGTLEFAAPEQFENAKHVDLRCDLYALATALYVALSGKYPFGGGAVYQILKKKMNNQIRPLQEVVETVTPATAQAIAWALNADPEQRPADCEQFLAALHGRAKAAISAPSNLPPAPVPEAERRNAPRYAVAMKTSCRPLRGAATRGVEVTLVDVSVTGFCVQTERRFEPKTMLEVVLSFEDEAAPATFVVQARWVRRYSADAWLIGCTFTTPLTAVEIDKLLHGCSEITRADDSPPTKHS